jgi:hypothetical protein
MQSDPAIAPQCLLWLQRVPTLGNGSFKLFERDAPPQMQALRAAR